MKKLIIPTILLCFMSMGSITYDLAITPNEIKEEITAVVDNINTDKESFEYKIINNNIEKFQNNEELFYDKTVTDHLNGKTSVKLNTTYNMNEFVNSYILNKCFDYVYVSNTDEYLYVKASGEFKCDFTDEVSLGLTTDMEIAKANYTEKVDNTYIWDLDLIKTCNEKHSDVTFFLSKVVKSSGEKSYTMEIVMAIVYAVLILLTIINKKVLKKFLKLK